MDFLDFERKYNRSRVYKETISGAAALREAVIDDDRFTLGLLLGVVAIVLELARSERAQMLN